MNLDGSHQHRPADLTSARRVSDSTPHNAIVEFTVIDLGSGRAEKLGADPFKPVPVPVWRLIVSGVANFAVVLVFGLLVVSVGPALLGYRPVIVSSASMEPTIRSGDVVVTEAPSNELPGVGTVINFETGEGSVIHRVVSVEGSQVRTAGDANASTDPDPVSLDQVQGVGLLVVPFVGMPELWRVRGRWLWLVWGFLLFAAAIYVSRAEWLSGRRPRWAR
ncbi:MAG: signal peptidase I [Actinomycetia bacterium]|nr:signal peptidase I [Actinomycetes bacterium]MCP4962331.1 signal peptidase I [Actinomycetes bacterium]